MDDLTPNPTPTPEPTPTPPSRGEPASSKLLTVGILLAALALAFVWIHEDSTGKPRAAAGGSGPGRGKIGSTAPALKLKDLQGKDVNLEELRGKVVIVDFWATWCQPCEVMIPWFIEFKNRYGAQGLEIVGVAMDDEGLDAVKPYAEKMKMNYVLLLGTEDAAEAWGGIFGLPTTFILDRQGRIHNRHVGLVSKSEFEKDIRELL
jgi:cytochrome c biogenesis protein CcmG/thiol:disulfide interchange protein DsbE